MGSKKSFVLRVDSTVYDALEKWADDEFRSVNGQLEWIITKALSDAGRRPKPQQSKKETPDKKGK